MGCNSSLIGKVITPFLVEQQQQIMNINNYKWQTHHLSSTSEKDKAFALYCSNGQVRRRMLGNSWEPFVTAIPKIFRCQVKLLVDN